MKTLKFFLYLSFLLIGALTFAACSDDEDKDKDGEPDIESGWSQSADGNTLTYTATASYGGATATAKWTFVFTNEKCTKATFVATYPTASIAKEEYNAEYKDNENATLSGKTITVDETEEYAGQDKTFIKKVIEAMAEHF